MWRLYFVEIGLGNKEYEPVKLNTRERFRFLK
jgi:hypothetical protein